MGFLEERLKGIGNAASNVGSGWSFKSIGLIVVLIAIFLGIAYYIYKNYIEPSLKPTYISNNEFQTDESVARLDEQVKQLGEKHATFYLFYTDWCPYSKKVMPIWDKIQSKFDSKIKDTDYVIDYVKINGESQAKDLEQFQTDYLADAQKNKIDGYPSIYMVKDDQVVEFEAQPTEETLTEFINTMF